MRILTWLKNHKKHVPSDLNQLDLSNRENHNNKEKYTNAEMKIINSVINGSPSTNVAATPQVSFAQHQQFLIKQRNIIASIIAFCEVTDSKGEKVLQILPNPDSDTYKQETERLKMGLCFGLSHMFLAACFITDMQDKKPVTDEDDLSNFYRCLLMLTFPEQLNDAQKQEVANFVGKVLFLHNTGNLPSSIPTRLFNVNDESFVTDDDPLKQRNHVENQEFTGDNEIFYEEPKDIQLNGGLDHDFESLLTRNGPLYVSFRIVTQGASHATCLYKDKDGKFSYYDPNEGIEPLTIKNSDDLMSLRIRLTNVISAIPNPNKGIYIDPELEITPRISMTIGTPQERPTNKATI